MSEGKFSGEAIGFLADELEDECLAFKNVSCPTDTGKISFPLILLHDTGIYAFIAEKPVFSRLLVPMNALRGVLTYSPDKYHLFAFGENGELYRLYWSKNTVLEESLPVAETLRGMFSRLECVFSQEEVTELAYTLNLMVEDKSSAVRLGPEGKKYINIRGQWRQMSSHSTKTVFYITLFLGPFGVHKFLHGELFKGVLYALTCGLFGVGWFIDCLRVIFLPVKDRYGKVMAPLSCKPMKFAMLLICAVFVGLLIYLYVAFYTLILSRLGLLAQNTDFSGAADFVIRATR